METRPLSKEKRWRIAEIIARGDVAEIQPGEIAVPEEVRMRTEAPPAVVPTDGPDPEGAAGEAKEE
jgi:hypothetical protein